jgi:hypothetical protein
MPVTDCHEICRRLLAKVSWGANENNQERTGAQTALRTDQLDRLAVFGSWVSDFGGANLTLEQCDLSPCPRRAMCSQCPVQLPRYSAKRPRLSRVTSLKSGGSMSFRLTTA